MPTHDDVLEFWFGALRADGTAAPDVGARWWKKDAAFDAEVRSRFGAALEAASAGRLDAWAESPAGAVALVILLDQLSRNAFRDTPRAFAQDARARSIAERVVDAGWLHTLPPMHAYFLVMPFMHAEDVDAQRRCVALFEELRDRAPNDALRSVFAGGVDFAERHRVIVERFGRFPHRNALLGRASTPEELSFLEQPGSSF